MFPPIEWDSLTPTEQSYIAGIAETSPLAFTAIWYNISQSDSFRPNWHHHLFDYAAKKVLSREVTNIIVNIPPGGTKTEFWSIHLPVYCMVQFPRVRILNTSYSKDLVNENSDRSRALVKSAEFQQFYPYNIGKDKVDDWTIENSNGKRLHQLFSRASGGQITGVRGGYMNDDFSGYIMADDWDKIGDLFSEARRKKSHTILTNTLRSRRANSRTPFIFIQQRGHVDDSTAFLLAGGMGLSVDMHIKIPALINQDYIDSLPDGIRERCIADVCHTEQTEDGYWSYWPSKDTVKDLADLRESHPYTFESQYQQAPDKLDGGIFDGDAFLLYGDDVDEDGRLIADVETPRFWEYRFITVDTAQKTKEHNDWTVFAEWGVHKGLLYRLNYQRERMTAKQLRRKAEIFISACWEKNSPVQGNLRYFAVEDKSSGTGLIQELDGSVPCKVKAIPRTRDKYTRAMDCQHHQAAGKVRLPYGDPANYEFIAEVASFTADDSHAFDDQTDVMMDAIELAIIAPATKKRKQVAKPRWMNG